MRNYWIRIALGALGIFAVGMLGITGVRALKGKVSRTLNSTDPIRIPVIGLVPFRVGSTKLGSVSRVEFLRSDPQHVSGVRVVVKLADSVVPAQLGQCQLALDDVEHINDKTAFSCHSTAGPVPGLEPFGFVVIENTSDTIPLLLPAKATADLRATTIALNKHGLQIHGPRDSIGELAAARLDSLRDELEAQIDARTDSIDTLKDAASELEDSSSNVPAAERRKLQKSADSVRAMMRAMVERLKLDEARMQRFDSRTELTPGQRDSLARLGPMLADSIRREVARELEQVRVDLNRQQRPSSRVEVPSPPDPPRPR